jgi:hypothetical protein
MPTIANQGITRGTITLYEQGDWFGDVSTVAGELIPNGTRVNVVVENVTLSGAVVRGGISGDVPRYQLAGRPEWSKSITPRPYQNASVLRSTVFADVAREALGSSWQPLVVAPLESKLGGHYERVGSNGNVVVLARDAIGSLGLPWYVRNDGITVFGTRPTGTVTTQERILVSERNDAIGLRYVNCDDVAAFAPGLTFENEVIGELSYLIEPEDVSLQIWTRAASNAPLDWLRMAWRRLFPRVELQGLFSYSTAGLTSNGKHSLRSTTSRHLPDIGAADAWTVAGHTAELTPGTRVLVSFADGNPATPVIVAVDPSTLPTSSSLEAVASLDVDAASIGLGAAEAAVLRSGDAVSIVTLPGPVVVAAGLIFRNADLVTPVPTAIPTKVKA